MLCLVWLLPAAARADVWGYVDAKGVAHFASDRLDERYELFFKGAGDFQAGRDSGAEGLASASSDRYAGASGAAAAPAKLTAFFEVSLGYKAVKHLLRDAAARHDIDYELLQALIATESGFDALAVSPKGAVGLMQLIPPTAARYGVRADHSGAIEKKLTDPKINIGAGTRYLRDLLNRFPGQLELAIAAYNAGEGAVQRAGNRVPNYPETRNYVKTVLQLYAQLKPPAATRSRAAAGSGRVRMEMMGGAHGRGNMPGSMASKSTTPDARPDVEPYGD
ncbi:MAG: lytic transglycosylase domain-containing protein [Pseudomonadota bacterium]